MIREIKIQQGRKWITAFEYRLHAFTTAKGTFTLIGTAHDWTDTFKNIDTGTFHDFPRQSIKKWYEQGKIQPVPEATSVMWLETHGNRATIKRK